MYILGTSQDFDNRIQTWLRAVSVALDKKLDELWSNNKKVIGADVDPP